jgi:hypothetical protein
VLLLFYAVASYAPGVLLVGGFGISVFFVSPGTFVLLLGTVELFLLPLSAELEFDSKPFLLELLLPAESELPLELLLSTSRVVDVFFLLELTF